MKLEVMRDRYRSLLIFEGGDAAATGEQVSMLEKHTVEMRERDMLVAGVHATGTQLPVTTLSADGWRAARARFHVRPTEFTVILLGKDGGEKLRSNKPLRWEELQTTIDSMPMRKQEVRSR